VDFDRAGRSGESVRDALRFEIDTDKGRDIGAALAVPLRFKSISASIVDAPMALS
jgi:hypothetical protein